MPIIWAMSLASMGLAQPMGMPGMESFGPASRPNLHGGGFGNLPRVVDLALSSDGRHLAAAYFVSPMNEPGTDWDAWVAVWDLTSGERTIIPNATQPLAISPEGHWLAMGLYKHMRRSGWGDGPRSEPALWKTGAVEPVRKLACDIKPGKWLAWTFSADGKELFAFDDDGRLLRWGIVGESAAEKIDTLAVPDGKTPATPGDQRSKWQQPVNLLAAGDRLVLIAPLQDAQWQRKSYTIEASWSNGKATWSRSNLEVIKTPHYSRSHTEHLLALPGRPYGLSLPVELAFLHIHDRQPQHSRFDGPSRLVFALKSTPLRSSKPVLGWQRCRRSTASEWRVSCHGRPCIHSGWHKVDRVGPPRHTAILGCCNRPNCPHSASR